MQNYGRGQFGLADLLDSLSLYSVFNGSENNREKIGTPGYYGGPVKIPGYTSRPVKKPQIQPYSQSVQLVPSERENPAYGSTPVYSGAPVQMQNTGYVQPGKDSRRNPYQYDDQPYQSSPYFWDNPVR